MDFERIHHDQGLYFRDDPDAQDAWYEKEPGNEDVQVGCDLVTKNDMYRYVWHREKSNINVENHGFSFYLARRAYSDVFRIEDGQRIPGTTAKIQTDEGNSGTICALDLTATYSVPRKIPFKAQVVLFVRQVSLDHGRVRVVSCYVPDDQYYWDTYWRFWFYAVAGDDGGFVDEDGSFRRLEELESFKRSRTMTEVAIEKLRLEFIKSLKEGRKTFLKLVTAKRPPNVR